ncbi:MAG TPA: ribosome maturation factor RimM [Moraxellaceae bacterium]|nr:ribosome maturation factor RimM [Moraxellaceae bacterium]
MGPGRAAIAAAPAPDAGDLIAVGHVSTAHGIKGWVWIHSLTDPASNIFGYRPWYLRSRDGLRQVKVVDWREQGKGVVALLDVVTDRNVAETLRNQEILVPKSALPDLEEGDYYWSDLIDLEVRTEAGQLLGVVHGLMETGSNDVLVVRGTAESIDRNERLIPWLPGSVVKNVDLAARQITVDWDPGF